MRGELVVVKERGSQQGGSDRSTNDSRRYIYRPARAGRPAHLQTPIDHPTIQAYRLVLGREFG